MKIRIIGDIHANYEHYQNICGQAEKEGLTTVQLGDLGFDYDKAYRTPEAEISSQHYFFGGNHDNYSTITYEPHNLGDHGNLDCLGRPDIYFIRGASTVDKWRRTEGVNWFPEEELSYYTMCEVLKEWEKQKPDILITHDCAAAEQWRLVPPPFKPSRTGSLITSMYNVHVPKIHVFGHYHVSLDETVIVNNKEIRLVCICADPNFQNEKETIDI